MSAPAAATVDFRKKKDAPKSEPSDANTSPYATYKAGEEPPRLKVWQPSEIWAPLEPPDYLVDGLFVRGSLALIVAYGSSLKTWLEIDLALGAATGSTWAGRFTCKKVPALVIDFESGPWELRRRSHLTAAGRGLALPVAGFAFVTMPALSLVDDAFFAEVRRLTADYGLIAIDSLPAGSGGVDENDARFAAPLNKLKAIASETGCVIVLLHHSRKGSPGEGSKTDEREMVRGSSAIFNVCDVVLSLTRGEDGAFIVRQTKARGGKAVEPFVVRVDNVGPDAVRVTATDMADADAAEASKPLQQAMAAVVALLAQAHDLGSRNAICRRIAGKRTTKLAAIDDLLERGVIVEHGGAFCLRSEVA